MRCFVTDIVARSFAVELTWMRELLLLLLFMAHWRRKPWRYWVRTYGIGRCTGSC